MTNTITTANIATAKTAELVAFYNEHAVTPIKKFRDRATAEARVADLLQAMTEDLTAADETLLAQQFEEYMLEQEPNHEPEAYRPQVDPAFQAMIDDLITPTTEAETPKRRVCTAAAKQAIAESFKLDRTTVDLTTGEVFPHAGKIWTIYGTERMTYATHDKLTRTLYGAAKKGERATFEAGGHVYVLASFMTDEENEELPEGEFCDEE